MKVYHLSGIGLVAVAMIGAGTLGLVPATRAADNAKPISLFNGKDLSNWHVDVPKMDKDPNAKSPFIVRDGMVVSLGTPGGHLITNAVYKNYRLEVEYRFAAKPGNCGVLVHASTPRALYKMFPKSIEVQMLHQNAGDFWCIVEDITVSDMVTRRGPKEKWGITEGKARRIKNLTDDSEKPVGQWNTMVIECVGADVKVWVNGDLVNHGTGCTATQGQIALQAEGSEVEFRKLLLTPITESAEWTSLFDGKTLNGWIQKNGTATYEVVDGTIEGTTKEGSWNSFLCSEKEYGDFELEFEVKDDNKLNSGVQIRSKTREKTIGKGPNNAAGRVMGPQVEIEASGEKGAEAGYIYAEATGLGWLTPKERLIPHKQFKDGQWNHFRVVAKGPRIQTWINGKAIEDLNDSKAYEMFPRGFLGLQVHRIKPGAGPYKVAWRNIRIREL